MGERETERLRDIVSHRDHAVMVYFRRARRWEAFGRKWFGLAKRLSGTLQMMDALAKDQAATIDTLFAERDTARSECERLAALAYIGDHRFPDLTYKSRLDECAHDLRKAESERDTARRELDESGVALQEALQLDAEHELSTLQMVAALAQYRDDAEASADTAVEDRDAARRELGECRAMVETHRQAARAANFKAWTAYNDGREDALNELADALARALEEKGNG